MSAEESGLSDNDLPLAANARDQRRRRGRYWLIAGGVVAAALAGVWLERRPIAAGIIDGKLRQWGVAARYRIVDLGLGRQRLEDVVIGNPAHPDLVADWVSVDTGLGLDGARVIGVRAGNVRVRGRLVGGTLSLGDIDKLLPATSGKPFALPAIDLSVDNARMRLETPAGIVGLRLAGHGRLDDGFAGDLAAVSERISAGGCTAERLATVLKVSIAGAQPRLSGPVRASRLDCAGVSGGGVVIDQTTTLAETLDRWEGSARIAVARLDHPAAQLRGVDGRIDYSGSAANTHGKLSLAAATLASPAGAARAAHVDGDYGIGKDGATFKGGVGARLSLAQRWRTAAARIGGAAPGTPVEPLLARLGKASADATRDLAVSGDVALASNGMLSISRLDARSASGAVATLNGGRGVTVDTAHGAARIDGLLALSGGGMPDLVLRVRPGPNGGISGTGLVRPYAAGNARLALETLDITTMRGGAARFATRAVLSGPLGDGRVEGARLPLTGVWDGRRLAINPACTPVSADRVTTAGLDLARPKLTLCPQGGALVTIAGNRVSGGARAENVALAGTLGGTPLALSAGHIDYRLGDGRIAGAGISTRLGQGDAETRIDIATLDGRLDSGPNGVAAAGKFDGAGGHIVNVPLVMSAAAGTWSFAGGKLSLGGALTVADANPSPRFNPLAAKGVELVLADNRITATGTLVAPATGVGVSDVRIVHDLGTGAGRADLDVPELTFGPKLQPDQLTPLTFGAIADVKGTVTGEGHIRWDRKGVTSDGVFETKDTNLAAAFGPVQGLSTRVRFTDLLNMVTAPDQVATVVSINPGVAVENGVVHYALHADQKVEVISAEWPFASGRLTLDPTMLDFTEHHERNLTFRMHGVDAAQFLQQFNFKNLDATGTFDGTLPMIFNEKGGRIEDGHLTVRETGGMIAYVGELSQKDLGFWGNMAFQSLKALEYKSLSIDMGGPLDGEVITTIHFAGVRQGKGAKRNFLVSRLAHLPLVFNVKITAPFQQLLGSVQGFYDPSVLIKRNLPALQRAQEEAERARQAQQQGQAPPSAQPPSALPPPAQPIQPPESEKRP